MTSSTPYQEVVPRRAVTRHVRNVAYRVHEWGEPDEQPLILLHGWGDTGASFQFVVDAFVAARFVVAPDWRGFGGSERNRDTYWFPDYLADLHALLEFYSPAAPAPLVGHSMGANVAALYAGVFPERVSEFVNVEGFGLADSDPDHAPAHYRRWIEAAGRARDHGGYENFDALVAKILERSPRLDAGRAHYIARLWAAAGDDGRVHLAADPAHRWPNAVQYRRLEAEACWRHIRAPVLLVSGELTAFTAGAETWLERGTADLPLAAAATVTVPGAGHMLHFEQPARLAAIIEDFLAAPRGSA